MFEEFFKKLIKTCKKRWIFLGIRHMTYYTFLESARDADSESVIVFEENAQMSMPGASGVHGMITLLPIQIA